MPLWLQNFAVFLLVAACLAYVTRQAFRALAGRKSGIGSCCAKGCAAVADEQAKSNTAPKVQFMPVEMLTRNRPRA